MESIIAKTPNIVFNKYFLQQYSYDDELDW